MREESHILQELTERPFSSLDITGRGWAGLKSGQAASIISFDGAETEVPIEPRFPIVRRLPDGHVLVVDTRTDGEQPNAWLVSADGQIDEEFLIGDGVEGVLVSKSFIVATYFDEGILGGKGPSQEGVSVFDHRGNHLWGYNSRFGSGDDYIVDCYCATWHDDHTVAFVPYTSFDLVLLDLNGESRRVLSPPSDMSGCSAVSTMAEVAWFHAPYDSRAFLRWSFDSSRLEPAGEYSPRLRGLSRGRFLAAGDHGYTVIDMTEPG